MRTSGEALLGLVPTSIGGTDVEFKRLRRGKYESDERNRHKRIFRQAAALIDERRLSVDIDVNYKKELRDIPESYLVLRPVCNLSKQALSNGYDSSPWRAHHASRPSATLS